MKKQWIYYGIGVTASVIYLLLTFLAPATSNAFGLSSLQILLLKITVALPYIATWIFGVYGLSTLDKYIELTKDKNDNMTNTLIFLRSGLLWIIMGTILVGVIGSARSYFATNTEIRPLFTIVTNYLYIFPQLIGWGTERKKRLLQNSSKCRTKLDIPFAGRIIRR